MRDQELKYPKWQEPLRELLLEFDHDRLLKKIDQVETLISERHNQLGNSSDSRPERDAINDARNIVRMIQRDKLGFPDWKTWRP